MAGPGDLDGLAPQGLCQVRQEIGLDIRPRVVQVDGQVCERVGLGVDRGQAGTVQAELGQEAGGAGGEGLRVARGGAAGFGFGEQSAARSSGPGELVGMERGLPGRWSGGGYETIKLGAGAHRGRLRRPAWPRHG